jgi:proteasome lid subunit RPN8/RPN11
MLILRDGVGRDIRAAGEREYPNECCGVLLGQFRGDGLRVALGLFPVENAREEQARHHRFVITPEDFMRAELEARRRALDVIGIYHSHPDHPAAPSDYDLEHALPSYAYVIVAVDTGEAAELTSWALSPDRIAFNKEEIIWQ